MFVCLCVCGVAPCKPLPVSVLSDPAFLDLDQYDVVSLSDALRGFLQDLPASIIPAAVHSELLHAAQGMLRLKGQLAQNTWTGSEVIPVSIYGDEQAALVAGCSTAQKPLHVSRWRRPPETSWSPRDEPSFLSLDSVIPLTGRRST